MPQIHRSSRQRAGQFKDRTATRNSAQMAARIGEAERIAARIALEAEERADRQRTARAQRSALLQPRKFSWEKDQ